MLFDQALSQHTHALALTDLERQRSWQQLQDQAVRFARYLREEQGLQPDDHLALLIGNRVEFFEALLGALLAGLWVTPINTHLVAEEVQYIAVDSTAKLILHDMAHAHLLASSLTSRCVNVEALSQAFLESVTPVIPISHDAPAGGTMLYTSGTTGRPKGVKRSKPATLGEALQRMASGGLAFGLDGQGAHLVTGPLYHAAPMLFALYDMLNGASMVIMPRWDIDVFLRCVETYRITHTHLVPTMCVRLLHAREREAARVDQHDLSSLTLVLHGAAPMDVATKHAMINWWGPILVEYWGGSEAGTTTLVTSAEWLLHPGTVGRPLAHFEVYVGDDAGVPVPRPLTDDSAEFPGITGKLFARHHYLSQVFEYHNDPAKTRKAHPQPHVFCIGDIGRVDADGFVYLTDRESNLIISGGVNIYPAEVEQVWMSHPAVEDVAVFGVPNAEWGEVVHAAVQVKPHIAANEELKEEMLAFLRERVARFKIPRAITFVDLLPRTPTGKLLVRQLRAGLLS